MPHTPPLIIFSTKTIHKLRAITQLKIYEKLNAVVSTRNGVYKFHYIFKSRAITL